ncbi:MAG: MoaD/ThiS family protein [Nitrosomonadales bacterium]|nr:MoaD/ThiS family protein [Nitrosomonadales bacterium]
MRKFLRSLYWSDYAKKHQVEIMYFGHASDALMMTSERMDIQDGIVSVKQVLERLRQRGTRWAYVLDANEVICAINGKAASPSAKFAAGDEIGIFSRMPACAV